MGRSTEATDRRVRLGGRVVLCSASISAVVAAIAVHGDLDEAGAGDLRDEILRGVDDGMASITVDLSDAQLRSTEAVDVLARAAELMRNRGAVLVVVARDAGGRSVVVTGADVGPRLTAMLRG